MNGVARPVSWEPITSSWELHAKALFVFSKEKNDNPL